jgi:mono/diheme cytochrome c family protein
MKPTWTILGALIVAGSALAEPFPKADPQAGKKLFDDAKCMACHAQRFGGDGSSLFTRAERKVKSADALLKQVRACVTQLNVQWFPDEEEHVAAYLNQRYYKFK